MQTTRAVAPHEPPHKNTAHVSTRTAAIHAKGHTATYNAALCSAVSAQHLLVLSALCILESSDAKEAWYSAKAAAKSHKCTCGQQMRNTKPMHKLLLHQDSANTANKRLW
jgi:hypothetical protein